MSIPEVPIALVTGANRGLGFEVSRQLRCRTLRSSWQAATRPGGKAAAKRLRDEGLIVQFIELDVTKPVQIKRAATEIRRRYGKLDILVNNAGISVDGAHGRNSTGTVSTKALRKTFDVNFFGLVELTQRLLPLIRKSGAGRIVNVSSILGSMTVHSRERGMSYKPFAYDASKTAVNVFTIHLAAALAGTNVKVNSVHPWWVRTDMAVPVRCCRPRRGQVRLSGWRPWAPTVRRENSFPATMNCRGRSGIGRAILDVHDVIERCSTRRCSMLVRNSTARWEGGLKNGKGTMRIGAGAYEGKYSFASRFETRTRDQSRGTDRSGPCRMLLHGPVPGPGAVRIQARTH